MAFSQVKSYDIFKQYSQKNKQERIRNFAEMYINSIKVNPDDPHGYIDRGYKKLENSLIKESIQDFNEALQLDTNSAIAYCLKGMAYSQLNINDSANLYFSKALLKNPAYDWAYLERGNLFLKSNNLAQAETDYLNAMKLNPHAVFAYFNLGYLELLKENSKKSYSYYSKVVKLNPKLAEGYSRLADVSSLQKNYATAVKHINKAIKLDTTNTDYLLQKAVYLSEDKKYSEALTILSLSLKKDSSLFPPYYRTALIQIEIGKCEEGIKELMKGCKKKHLFIKASGYKENPMSFAENVLLQLETINNHDIFYKTVCSLIQGKNEEAFMQTKGLHQKDSTQALTYKLLGFFYVHAGLPDSALLMYNHYLEAVPHDAEVLELRGDIYNLQENFDMAEKDYQDALTLGRKYLELYCKTGYAQSTLNNNADALLNISKALEADTTIPLLYNLRGYIRSQLGEKVKAIADFKKAIQLDSNFALPYNNTGRELLETGDTTTALYYLMKAISIDSTLYYPYYNLSLIYESRQDYEKAMFYRIRYVRYNTSEKSNSSAKSGIHSHMQTLKQGTDTDNTLYANKAKLSADNNRRRTVDSSEYFRNKSYTLMQADSLEESIVNINKAIKKRTYYAQYHLFKYALYAMQQKYAAAIDLLDSIHTTFPETNIYHKKGHCYSQLGNDSLAIVNFTKSIVLFPGDTPNYVEFAAFYYEKQAYAKAREIITKVYSVDSLDMDVLQEAGIIYTANKEYELALKAYTKVLLMDKNSSLAYGNMAWVKYLQGKFSECIELSKKAIDLDEEAFYAKYNLALSLLCLKRHNESIAYYRKTYAQQKKIYEEPNMDGTFADLIDLIKANKFIKESRNILKTVFGLTDSKINDLVKK